MIDTSEGIVSDGIDRACIVIYHLKTIFANQIRAAGQAKLKLLAERVIDSVLKCSDRRLIVLNAQERVACHRGKSQEPVISNRKNIARLEVSGAHVLRADIGFEIGLRLVTGVNAGVERKPCRAVM